MSGERVLNADEPISSILVSGLHTYPVKSCAGLSLTQSRVTVRGLELDRNFMLVDDDDDFVSQRKVPELALVVPSIDAGAMTLTAPGIESILVPLHFTPDDDRSVLATVHGRPVAGQLVGDDLDDWFTTFLPRYRNHRRFRLLRVRDDVPGYINKRYHRDGASNQVGFADGNSLLLATEPSLADLNASLDEPVPMNRFRPNIVVDGPFLAAYEEDHWLELRIGSLRAFVVKACDRCSIPDTNQATGAVGKAVRRALLTRRGVNAHDVSNTGVFFSQNLNHIHDPHAIVALGDAVEVLARSLAPNVKLAARRTTRLIPTPPQPVGERV
jgi:uncharacterized protein YcbX